jgi:hypothetical protein
VDEYLVRADVHGTYIKFVCDEYNQFDDDRKRLSPSLFTLGVPVVECIPSYPVLKNPCNLDPWGHYSSVIEATLLLDRRFQLGLPERLSLLRAMAVCPNSSYLYVAAAASLLQQRRLDPKHRTKYRFGLLVATTMRDIHTSLVSEKRNLPPRRFNCYATYAVPDEMEWNEQCNRLLILHLTTADTKLKSERQLAYEEVRVSLASIFPYVDILGGNHLVAIAGSLGLLPLWVTTEIEVHKGRAMKWLLEKFFPNEKERKRIKLDDVISNIMGALKTTTGCEFSRRTVENIICKIFRRHTRNRSDGLFWDILVPDQNLYSVQGNAIHVRSSNGELIHKTKGPLLSLVPFRGSYITLQELRAHIPKNWPTWDLTVASLGSAFLEGIFDPRRGEYPEASFELNQRCARNRWLSDKFAATERRLLS